MKILRTKKDTDKIKKKLVDKYKKARAGCKSCPCCGATENIDSKEIACGVLADLHITKYNKVYRCNGTLACIKRAKNKRIFAEHVYRVCN